jgi:hypothetical protein
LKRIEANPNQRQYPRLILHVDDLKTLLEIANSIDGAKLQINDYEIATDADITTLLTQGHCIRNVDFSTFSTSSLKLSLPSLSCHISPWHASLHIYGAATASRDLFLRVDILMRQREAFFSDKILATTIYGLQFLLAILPIWVGYTYGVNAYWRSLSVFVVCWLGLFQILRRKQKCLKIRGRGVSTRVRNWLPNPSGIITSLITAAIIGFFTLVCGVYFAPYLKPLLDRVLPASVSSGLSSGVPK